MADHRVPWQRSIRTRIVLVSIAVEVTMLALLLWNSVRLLDGNLTEQTQARLEATAPLLNAALAAPLFERDHASIREILSSLVRDGAAELRYVVVLDERGVVYATAGNVNRAQLPPLDREATAGLDDMVYDTSTPLSLAGERIGEARYGLSLVAMLRSRDAVFGQGAVIAVLEIALSMLLLGIAGALLTRDIRYLVDATRQIAAGDYSGHLPIESRTEMGLLARCFQRMMESVRERVEALRRSEQMLAEEKERALVTLDSIGDGVITTDVDGVVQGLNPAAERLTGWTAAEARGRPLDDVYRVVDEAANAPRPSPVTTAIGQRTIVRHGGQTVLLGRDGQEHAVEETASPIRARDGSVQGAVLVFRDVTATRDFARQLEYQARHDALTGLVNRNEFERLVKIALDMAREHDQTHVLCYLDLDQFKVVNDTCGHMAGDELLRQLANVLGNHVRESDVVGRLGGDEFGVLVHRCPLSRSRQVAESLRDAVQTFRFAWENKSFDVGVSIGVAPLRADSGAVSEIFAAADVACYVAKDKGRNQIHIYQADDLEHARRRGEMHWSTRITQALADDRFLLFHQHILPLDAGAPDPFACELLVRLVDENGSLVLPGRFVPAAERFHQMGAIDRWVVAPALRWGIGCGAQRAGMFTVNLSGQSLSDPEFLEFVRHELDATGMPPGRLCFEITETSAIANLARVTQFMTDLRAFGCRFALDDFGSGLSSFAYLQALPVDYLKIDGGFVRHMLHNVNDRAMVSTIHQLGHTMGIKTIAECIEDETTLAAVRELGVDYGQGFAIHIPEPLAEPATATRARNGRDG